MGFIERKMRMPIEIVCRESHARVCCKVCNAKISPLSTADEKIRIEWLRLAIARSANNWCISILFSNEKFWPSSAKADKNVYF